MVELLETQIIIEDVEADKQYEVMMSQWEPGSTEWFILYTRSQMTPMFHECYGLFKGAEHYKLSKYSSIKFIVGKETIQIRGIVRNSWQHMGKFTRNSKEAS